ncbi:DUF928 domain-containing protein [Geitlerinema sp. P-1104]|uniref:DUF928 domain-containing protein n=1 Tax=Geitlerinema sp. P-1104 TaxID=2546230 RepID=UPI0014773CE5|nr:DUF928 domain-containing protein [Geitlerinema sp. P-1104]NMG60457.1 DUF928 domain-containing protein [Geitlerinema sp. P-1104]
MMNLLLSKTTQIVLLLSPWMGNSLPGIETTNFENTLIQQFLQNWVEIAVPESMNRSSSENNHNRGLDDNQNARSRDEDEDEDEDEDDYGSPTNRTAGTDRDNCPATTLPLTALIPARSPIFTVSESPTLWFYSPYQAGQVEVGELTYVNSNNEQVYRGFFELPDDPGIISLQVPETSSLELTMDENYHWFLRLYCDPRDAFSYVYVDAPIRRVAEQSDQGIGYDDVTDIATQFTQNPDDGELKESWQNLAEMLDLEEVMQKPLIDCCEVED